MNLIVPAWVSTRNYQSESSSKSIVANDLDHEIVTFDDASADLWALMVSDSDTQGYFNIEAIAAKYQAPVDEVHSFVDVLIGANLISQNRSSEVFNDYKSNTKPKIMSSQKYAAGGYYESAPGGTNLEVENDVLEFAAKNSYLYAATWEITYRCNESCVHCFNPGASHVAGDKPKRKTDELTTEEAFEFLLDLRQSGVFRLLITGGEVFLRKDIYEILRSNDIQR
jgi:sulfatase maturation enzyme AslB (radical SAM superfamily)